MTPPWPLARRRIEVDCLVEIEQSAEFLHAHAIPEGIALRPGDIVVVHDAPDHVDFGSSLSVRRRATVFRAGPLARWWTRTTGLAGFAELYEVGFLPKGEFR